MPTRLATCLALLVCAAPLLGAEPPADTRRGDQMLEAYFRQQTKQIADACLRDIKSRADWEKKRPELRRQFLEMMGLWPLPPRTDLRPVITGKVEADHFTIEKLHFQSSPGLYVSANLYVPKEAKWPAPAVLYVCGHASTYGPNKVSYGNKVNYQHHPAWFAEHGYVCLIVDTLQLGELQGLHHGTHHLNLWWWQTLGYTPAGIECWNAMRALDYLETRKEVDPKRIGVTGRSGGGATSWWVAAADDRPQCIIPVAGIGDLQAHVVEGIAPRLRKGVISGHCDCMYFVNTYRWDFPLVAALCAPRPLMLANSDVDDIFPVPGYRRLADKVRRIYDLYDAGSRFVLLETAGPHKDTVDLRLGAYRWMNRWLQGDSGSEASERERPRVPPEQLQVFHRPPDDAANAFIHETFIKPARPALPQVPAVAKEWWPGQSQAWMQALREKVFRGWPQQPPALNTRPAADVRHHGLRLRAFDFTSEDQVELRLWLLTGEPVVQPDFLAAFSGSPEAGLAGLPWAGLHGSSRRAWFPRPKEHKPALVVLNALDEAGWAEWLQDLGPAFAESLQISRPVKADAERFHRLQRLLQLQPWAFALIAPRGIGPSRWAEAETPAEAHIRRRFALLGQTLDGQRVWDVRRGLAVLRGVPDLKGVPLWLQGKGDMAGIVLYAGIFEPDVVRLDLWQLPASHGQGPTFLNVRRILDMPQALALAFPRAIRLYTKEEREARVWEWPLQLQKGLGQEYLKIRQLSN
jgi:dienelactone hydrolase